MKLAEKDGFAVGDRVTLVVDCPDDNRELFAGDEGVILSIDDGHKYFAHVRWDKKTMKGHTSDGECEKGYGWWVRKNEIAVVALCELEPMNNADIGLLLA